MITDSEEKSRKKKKIIKGVTALFKITTGSIVAINHDAIYFYRDKHC